MSNPGFALQEAMRTALLGDATLVGLLQGHNVFDEVPRGVNAPYVVFGDIETRDWSTADALAHEHFASLNIRTNQRGRKLVQDIVAAIEAVLETAALTLAGHKLINLRLVFWTVIRDKNAETYGAAMRFRAATEPQ
ncbi:MAG: DUF3168 domain-containing protein [Rhizobiales bacterium]|nr:DUF3168 domain-containing protein [Hyphomicrobiales bacterium]MBI3672364.1 DUF3168 domain-containing protein [Hyphomicrobiales bacterium]